MDTGAAGRMPRPSRAVRDAPHVRVVGHRGRAPTLEIAATMGTSLEQLSKTYWHLLPDSANRARIALDAFLNAPEAATFADYARTRE